MRELLEAVEGVYTSQGVVSLRQVAEEFGIALLNARKLLITAGAFSTEMSGCANYIRMWKNAVWRIAEAGRSGDVEEWKRRIWEGIEAFQGDLFYTEEGEKFRYEIRGGES